MAIKPEPVFDVTIVLKSGVSVTLPFTKFKVREWVAIEGHQMLDIMLSEVALVHSKERK